jgi:SAM-dependent methyltransferase
MTKLQNPTRDWNDIGRLDPCWAVLVEPSRKHGGWETEEGRREFFATGETEIVALLRALDELGIAPRRGAALDFGCGVGRLTRALSLRFEECVGVDISASMVARAGELNADRPNSRFVVNTDDHLRQFADASFDLVFSSIVLQHVPGRETILRYVADFARILRPGGVMAFQLPSHIPLRRRIQPRRRLYGLLRSVGVKADVLYNSLGLMPMRMSAIPEAVVTKTLEANGMRMAKVVEDRSAGPEIESRMYFAVKQGAAAAR